ncbi:MAG: hypothetical protein LIP01_02095 [Tannerellaceae bacterium]|nr:hypothetical protein [Tannerellaceae bacterium]
MGEIADSLINGEFDYITGEYLGEPCGYPRTMESTPRRRHTTYQKADQSIRAMIKSRGAMSKHFPLINEFAELKGLEGLDMIERCEAIFTKYKNEFRKYLDEHKEAHYDEI